MRNFLKKFAAFFVAVCTVLSLCALAACGEEGDPNGGATTQTYTVTVSCEENPLLLSGVKVRLVSESGVAGESALTNGKASFTLEKGKYTVELIEVIDDILSDYVYAQTEVTESAPSATIEILPKEETGETVEYRVTVLKPDESPVGELAVQLCGGPKGLCWTARTDAQGVATFNLEAGEYEVHINILPDGYKFDNNEHKMTAEGGALTVHLTVA